MAGPHSHASCGHAPPRCPSQSSRTTAVRGGGAARAHVSRAARPQAPPGGPWPLPARRRAPALPAPAQSHPQPRAARACQKADASPRPPRSRGREGLHGSSHPPVGEPQAHCLERSALLGRPARAARLHRRGGQRRVRPWREVLPGVVVEEDTGHADERAECRPGGHRVAEPQDGEPDQEGPLEGVEHRLGHRAAHAHHRVGHHGLHVEGDAVQGEVQQEQRQRGVRPGHVGGRPARVGRRREAHGPEGQEHEGQLHNEGRRGRVELELHVSVLRGEELLGVDVLHAVHPVVEDSRPEADEVEGELRGAAEGQAPDHGDEAQGHRHARGLPQHHPREHHREEGGGALDGLREGHGHKLEREEARDHGDEAQGAHDEHVAQEGPGVDGSRGAARCRQLPPRLPGRGRPPGPLEALSEVHLAAPEDGRGHHLEGAQGGGAHVERV
mmetsp:Transcript_3143/g.10384  ORF Transcript_3143/g.10384 Transcript_3143/m.10384 type:complete len:443 (+) Transcript_3143:321-1649(+)